jgi:ABC-type multidrug transport system fused ATPase/permease subunit
LVFKYLKYFYKYLGFRLGVISILSILTAILDGIGIAFFLPLLEFIYKENNEVSGIQMGYFSAIFGLIKEVGLEINIFNILLIISVLFFVKGVVIFIDEYLKVYYQQYFVRQLRLESINALQKLNFRAFVNSDVGRIQNILTGEIQKVINGYGFFNLIIQGSVLILTYSILAIYANPSFAIFMLIGGFLSNSIFYKIFKKTKKISKKMVISNNQFQGLLIQSISNYKYLKATSRINLYFQKLRSTIIQIEENVIKNGILSSIVVGLREPIIILILIFAIFIQLQFLGTSLGGILLSVLFFYRALNHLNNSQKFYNKFLFVSGSIDAVDQFISELNNYEEDFHKNCELTQGELIIELKEVSFGYNESKLVLQDINLKIFKNQVIGIIGETGSGKTSLVNIITGLLNPISGNISRSNLSIGYITQEPVIFDETIYNNVTFWEEKSEFNDQKFWKVIRDVHLEDFVKSLESKENTRLGNNGINLSGGQRQRISIARELFREINLLIADEATSSLDSKTEFIIRENLEKYKGSLTQIIIAHRLATLKNADRIIFLKGGKIIKEGSFEELRLNLPEFQKWIELQKV